MLCVFECFGLVLWCFLWNMSEEPRQNQGRGLVDRKQVKVPPSNFIAGLPKEARSSVFWFFGDFRCGMLFFMVVLVIYRYKNR